VIWGSAPWERVAETLADLHDDVVAWLLPESGGMLALPRDRTGAIALRAARAARV
jgi:hypothetical protein